ncbi:hypothetical protein C8Q75DRAFT_803984 [Abortiporus biennis]|nr:hypothetical protein C8Q75DRAFT_803984 [Abortiporus biennis]
MSTSSGTSLTTSRISRLFRPLRAKCKTFSSACQKVNTRPRNAAIITYASSSRRKPKTDAEPPSNLTLDPIPPPQRLNTLTHLDDRSRELLPLSRSLYDVRDAFKNVIQAALGEVPILNADVGRAPLPTFTSLCAAVIGENIEMQMELYGNEDEEREDCMVGDKEAMIMDELYEATPLQYRPDAILPHAVAVVLDNCPHHPALLSLLLEVTLAYQIKRQSEHILRHLLRAAYCPSSTLQITSSRHSDYLVNLHRTTSRLELYQRNNPILDDGTFARILADVLPETTVDGWTCKATTRLMQRFYKENFSAFLTVCGGLAYCVAHNTHKLTSFSSAVDSSQDKKGNTSTLGLHTLLATWLQNALDRLQASGSRRGEQGSLNSSSSIQVVREEYQATIDLLDFTHSLGFHERQSTDDNIQTILSRLSCLAAYCLASPLFPSRNADNINVLQAILSSTTPTKDTFQPLISIIFSSAGEMDQSRPWIPGQLPTIDRLRTWSLPFRQASLYIHEASIWSCALRHVETRCGYITAAEEHDLFAADVEALDTLRLKLAVQVDEAERLCFGQVKSTPDVKPGKALTKKSWVWEELVGSFVERSPLMLKKKRAPTKLTRELQALQPVKSTKRPRAVDEDEFESILMPESSPLVSSQKKKSRREDSVASSSTGSATSSSYISSRMSMMSASPSPGRITAFKREVTPPSSSTFVPTSHSSPDHDKGDFENYVPTPMPSKILRRTSSSKSLSFETPVPARRLSNFNSILADAQMNRVVLHADSPIKFKTPMPKKTMQQTTRLSQLEPSSDNEDGEQTGNGYFEEYETPIKFDRDFDLSSDDALNLFQYSSPALMRPPRHK